MPRSTPRAGPASRAIVRARLFTLVAAATLLGASISPARADAPSAALQAKCRAFGTFYAAHAWDVDGGRMADAREGERLASQLAQGSEMCAGVLRYKHPMLQSATDDRNVAFGEYVVAANYARKQGAQQRACGYAGHAYRILAALRKIPGYLARHDDEKLVDGLGCHPGNS